MNITPEVNFIHAIRTASTLVEAMEIYRTKYLTMKHSTENNYMDVNCEKCGNRNTKGHFCNDMYSTEDTVESKIRGALARGYCTNGNAHKVLDPYLIEAMALEVEKVATSERTRCREEAWEQLQQYTIREKKENMTDWIDWDDVCKVFGKETALEERIREKKAELETLQALTTNTEVK